jgi:hypothetical protein
LLTSFSCFQSLLYYKSDTSFEMLTLACRKIVDQVHYDHYSNSECSGGGLDIPHPSLCTILSNQVKLAYFSPFVLFGDFYQTYFIIIIIDFVFYFFYILFFLFFYYYYLQFSDIQKILWLMYWETIHAFPTFPPRNLTRFKIYDYKYCH